MQATAERRPDDRADATARAPGNVLRGMLVRLRRDPAPATPAPGPRNPERVIAAAVSRKYYEVQDHFVVVPALGAYLHGYVNPGWYDGLSDKSKAALAKAGEEASGWALEASQAAAAAAPDELTAKGVQVHVATEAENEAFKAAMQPAFNAANARSSSAPDRACIDRSSDRISPPKGGFPESLGMPQQSAKALVRMMALPLSSMALEPK